MNEADLREVAIHYQKKEDYLNCKFFKLKVAKERIEKQRKKDLLHPLTEHQIQLKRKLMHRHIEKRPSLIGHCSPRDIEKMVARK
jgi:hypothetical protein